MLWGRDAGPCRMCVEVVACSYWGGCCRKSSAETWRCPEADQEERAPERFYWKRGGTLGVWPHCRLKCRPQLLLGPRKPSDNSSLPRKNWKLGWTWFLWFLSAILGIKYFVFYYYFFLLCVLKAAVRWCHLGLLLPLPSRPQQHPLEPQWRLRRLLWRKYNVVDHTCSTPNETLLYHVRLSHEWHVSSNLWQGAKLIWLQPSQGHEQHVPENNSAIVQVSVRQSWELGCLWLCAPT